MDNIRENTQENNTTLVLGGTGKTGRRVAEQFTARGLPVRIGSRSGEPSFDWEDQATWAATLLNVKAVYITYYPDLAVPGAVDAVRRFVELAMAGGIRRFVLLSGRGEKEAQHAEQVLQDSGADWTILRCSWFSQNFSENYLLDPIIGGEGRGTVRRRRRHRGCGRSGADRGPACRRALRADWSPATDFRGCSRGNR